MDGASRTKKKWFMDSLKRNDIYNPVNALPSQKDKERKYAFFTIYIEEEKTKLGVTFSKSFRIHFLRLPPTQQNSYSYKTKL